MSIRERLNLIIDKMTEEQMEALIVVLKRDEPHPKKASVDDIAGRLHKYANPELIPLEKDAWANAAVENYTEEMRSVSGNESY
ncbi:MAG: hypothetical protein NC084_04035 [Bacteroides sp.]|nr:hypothetical protein [Eubacterium sp.]MCM1417664.1 hypothetical protein [Roseburia sp.]MCM1461870.1 hypothetical protein [Bacteroides sp.]